MRLPKTTTKANAGGGAVSTFTATDIGLDPRNYHHRIVVEAAAAPFDVEVRVPDTDVWVTAFAGLEAADAGEVDGYGYDAIRVTCDGAAGDVFVQTLERIR